MTRHVYTTRWVCRVCGQHGLSWPGAFLATWRGHWVLNHDTTTDTAISIFARTR